MNSRVNRVTEHTRGLARRRRANLATPPEPAPRRPSMKPAARVRVSGDAPVPWLRSCQRLLPFDQYGPSRSILTISEREIDLFLSGKNGAPARGLGAARRKQKFGVDERIQSWLDGFDRRVHAMRADRGETSPGTTPSPNMGMTTMADQAAPRAPARIYVTGEPQDPLAARIFETIRSRGAPIGTIHRVLALAPKIFETTYNMAIANRTETKVDRSLNELMILRTTQVEGGEYEYQAHVPMALAMGLTQAQIDALAHWRESDLFDQRQRAVLTYADALFTRKHVPTDVFEALARELDPQEIVELTMISGFYTMASRLSCGVDMNPAVFSPE
ncbi:MAG: carboxymuconolactone decarboxylase family protein [Burkholderiaceae bacterium]